MSKTGKLASGVLIIAGGSLLTSAYAYWTWDGIKDMPSSGTHSIVKTIAVSNVLMVVGWGIVPMVDSIVTLYNSQ
jgi:hypothetical protein